MGRVGVNGRAEAGELGGTARCNGVGCRQWGVLG